LQVATLTQVYSKKLMQYLPSGKGWLMKKFHRRNNKRTVPMLND